MDLLHSLINKPFPFFFFSSLLFLSSFIFATVNNSDALSIQEQYIEDHFSALLHLKQRFSFSELSKTRLFSWNPGNRDCCSWEAITCDGATGHVIGLDLSYLSISGLLDFKSIFHLQSLQRLNLARNDFDLSRIPSGFDQLTSLTHLNLSSSNFYGQIPLEISLLTSLVSLDLSFNSLQLENPNIGALVQNLSSLRELYLDRVYISAEGSEWGLALSSALPRLRKLSLRGCGLSGPIHSSLSSLCFLSQLRLSGNSLSSVIPNFIGNFSSLTSLALSDCGLYGKIPESIFRLPNLQTLDVGYNPLLTGKIPPNNTLQGLVLSDTGFCSKLRDSFSNLELLTMLEIRDCKLSGQFPSGLVMLRKLARLDLSSSGFSGPLPSSLANLSNLVYLDLSANGFSGPFPSSLVNLSNLVYLDISSNDFSGPIPSSHGNKLQNLKELHCPDNSLSGTIPSSLFSLPSLRMLVLSGNQFSGHLVEFQNASSLPLESINLENNNLQGPIPRSIFQLTMLTYLALSSNSFNGTIPSLYGNDLRICVHLNLSNNSLSGTIPSSLFSLPSLREVLLQDNHFSGQLGEFHNASSLLLEKIYLDKNKLQGPIPRSIFQLTKLTELSLLSNNFNGDLDLGLFQNLKDLRYLDLSNNHFSVYDIGSNSTSISFPQIQHLLLRSCNISKFPDILRRQEEMYFLDLSNNRINGEIPNWIWKVGNESLTYFNLSHNDLEGLEGPFPHLSLSSLEVLDLSFNMLEGSIPIPPLFIHFFSLSSNNLSGEVPLLICNCTSLQVLDLSDNRLNGLIPPCLGEINDDLIVLNLGGNAFHGNLLQTFKEGCILETLDLNGNQLEGQVPRSLSMCKMLEVLNLGNNHIHDTFPFWLENLSQLRILILGSNKFYGTIGHPIINHSFPLLQISDLSSNRFTGSLPSNMFRSWKAMMEEGKSQSQFLSKQFVHGYYQDKVIVVSKGQEMKLVKILTAFTVVDLSNNQFQGVIPKSVGDLKALHVLNMSYNHLTGQIPASLGGIKDLESLDLSQNDLFGEIPQQLTKLTFLEVLNLSQNQLVGIIPQSQQFLTFTNESFQGNLGLCGPPLSRKCRDTKVSSLSTQSESKYDWGSMCIGFGVGYGVGMGILLWTTVLWTKGMKEYIRSRFLDRMLLMIFPSAAFDLIQRR
ncbi:receptor-like protein 53 [Magnolia sinica]|uniref:receptor-like protein 53 n=1 Tax=Magnolia sinica TaxID=86752 RepID=UPI002659DFF5|nr:receptor-like protein 53 [Magnolia sinica]